MLLILLLKKRLIGSHYSNVNSSPHQGLVLLEWWNWTESIADGWHDQAALPQVYHYCHFDGRQDSFLCANGTVFNQKVADGLSQLYDLWWIRCSPVTGGTTSTVPRLRICTASTMVSTRWTSEYKRNGGCDKYSLRMNPVFLLNLRAEVETILISANYRSY